MVRSLCRLPLEFKAAGNKSMLTLFAETGYLQDSVEVSQEAVAGELRRTPALIDAWCAYSEDQRVTSGWYVKAVGSGKYEVGLAPRGPRQIYSERADACSAFVLHQLAQLRSHAG